MAERHGVVEKTIRNWLDWFFLEPIEPAPYDAPRPRGPAKAEGDDREQLFEQLQQPPTELGYDQQAWSPTLLLHHVKEEYGVEYSKAYAYTLLNEADPEEKAKFQETAKKRPELSENTVVVIDQFTKHVGTVQRRGWYPIGSNPTIETTSSRSR